MLSQQSLQTSRITPEKVTRFDDGLILVKKQKVLESHPYSTYNILVFYSNKKNKENAVSFNTKTLGHVPDTHVVNSRYLVLNSDVQGELLGVMCYVC